VGAPAEEALERQPLVGVEVLAIVPRRRQAGLQVAGESCQIADIHALQLA